MEWETVIGLEIHAQLATKSKIFSGASTAYGAAPNTQACAIDLGLPVGRRGTAFTGHRRLLRHAGRDAGLRCRRVIDRRRRGC